MEADIHIYTLDSRKLPRPCLLYQLEPHIAQLKVTLSWRSLIEKRSLAFHLLTSRSGARASCVSWSRWAAPRAASRPPARQPSSWDVLAVDSPKSSPFPSLSLSLSIYLCPSVSLVLSHGRVVAPRFGCSVAFPRCSAPRGRLSCRCQAPQLTVSLAVGVDIYIYTRACATCSS